LFEIGVNRGGSVRAFREYFPNAIIVGLEKDGHCFFEEERIKIIIGDATNQEFIAEVISKFGNPDIVIDDGSHFSKDIKASFDLLFSRTKICYAIEDLLVQTKEFQNGFYVNDSEPATIVPIREVEKLLLGKSSCTSIKVYRSICLFMI
jgi:hypothetical protein